MLQLILLCIGLVSGFPGGDHRGDGHEDNCVDISQYSEILYNVSTQDVCTYRTSRKCETKQNSACVNIPITTCTAVAYADCKSIPFTQTLADDSTEINTFEGKECFESGTQTLIEVHHTPVCENVTKEHCESIWEVNELGEKVWAGNANCEVITWEDCRLEDVPNPIEVPIFTCQDMPAIEYTTPITGTVDVTGYTSECIASAYADCTTNYTQECEEIDYEECSDIIEPTCFEQVMFKIPYQTYDHRLKCIH